MTALRIAMGIFVSIMFWLLFFFLAFPRLLQLEVWLRSFHVVFYFMPVGWFLPGLIYGICIALIFCGCEMKASFVFSAALALLLFGPVLFVSGLPEQINSAKTIFYAAYAFKPLALVFSAAIGGVCVKTARKRWIGKEGRN